MPYTDFRDWLDQVRAMGELKEFRGAHWDLELGTICDLVSVKRKVKPAFLFDDVPGYPSGYRALVNPVNSLQRANLTVGMPLDTSEVEFIHEWRRRSKTAQPLPPTMVASRRAWSGPLDPAIRVGLKGHNSRAIIDACRPYEWIDQFPKVSDPSPELARKVAEKWGEVLKR